MQVLRNVWIMRKTNQARKPLPKGLSGRLTKSAGTHLASWLQEVTALTVEEAQTMLDTSKPIDSTVRGARAHAGLVEAHGKRAGHSKPITDMAHSGDLIATKDPRSMRLWRAHGDFALLRVVTCRGRNVSFHESGQYIVTGSRTEHIECIGDGGKSADAGVSSATRASWNTRAAKNMYSQKMVQRHTRHTRCMQHARTFFVNDPSTMAGNTSFDSEASSNLI